MALFFKILIFSRFDMISLRDSFRRGGRRNAEISNMHSRLLRFVPHNMLTALVVAGYYFFCFFAAMIVNYDKKKQELVFKSLV